MADDGQRSPDPGAAALRGVRAVLDEALEQSPRTGTAAGPYGDPVSAARAWLAHVEVFLAWVVEHPELTGIHADARRLLAELVGRDEGH